ncbi:hypothetical protein ACFWA9_24400 [Kitasatospora sp. NPDC059973]|uniref:hypothetical protein n=1 Tax=Kitasatospora sp. NPDC059973 TaxID=3347020 RepID=UPI00368A36AC
MPSRPRTPAYQPQIGEVVRDRAHRSPNGQPAEGVYMDTLGGAAYLRPEAGGCEWTTRPEDLQRLDRPRFLPVQHPSPPRANSAA